MGMTLRLNDDDNAKLREVAEREGRSMHEIAVTALHEYFARHEEFRANQVRRFLAEDADLLELLSRRRGSTMPIVSPRCSASGLSTFCR